MAKTIGITVVLSIFAALLDGLTGFLAVGFAVSNGAIGLISVVGQAAAVALEPVEIMFGYVVSLAIGISGGTMLIMLLLYNKMFNPGLTLRVFLGEVIPFWGIAPGWTYLAARSGYLKWKKEKASLSQEAGSEESDAANDNEPLSEEQSYELPQAA